MTWMPILLRTFLPNAMHGFFAAICSDNNLMFAMAVAEMVMVMVMEVVVIAVMEPPVITAILLVNVIMTGRSRIINRGLIHGKMDVTRAVICLLLVMMVATVVTTMVAMIAVLETLKDITLSGCY